MNLFWHYTDTICFKFEVLGKIYEKFIGSEYKKENNYIDMSKVKKVLHIGCGKYPISALILGENFDGGIVAIDNKYEVVEEASQVVKKKNLEDKIFIERGDGTNYPMDDFDVIIVSSCSVPKLDVLEHIFDSAKVDTKIIIREFGRGISPVVDLIDSNDDILFKEKIDNYSFPCFKWSSFYCLKK